MTNPAFLTPLSLTLSPTPLRPSLTAIRPRPSLRATCRRSHVIRAGTKEPPDDKDPHEIPSSAVDWNAEWTDFTASGMRSSAPKGRQPLSDVERQRREAVTKLRNATENLPSRQQLFADWRFWASIILVLSIFSALIQTNTMGGGAGVV